MHIAKVLLNLITEHREKQELAFRGHNENENSVNQGNFTELAKLLSRRQYVYQNEDVDMGNIHWIQETDRSNSRAGPRRQANSSRSRTPSC
jgi:hypothetical protein